jgi:hypothetical protein
MPKLTGTKPPDLYCIDTRCRGVTRHTHTGSVTRHGCESEWWQCRYCKRERLLMTPAKDS